MNPMAIPLLHASLTAWRWTGGKIPSHMGDYDGDEPLVEGQMVDVVDDELRLRAVIERIDRESGYVTLKASGEARASQTA
jgi:hypothetical protein